MEKTDERCLGKLEKIYYFCYKSLQDDFQYKVSFKSRYDIHINQVQDSISALVKQHHVLGMEFVEKGSEVLLVRTKNRLDLKIVSKEKFDEIFENFPLEGKMWDFYIQERSDDEKGTLTFIMGINHVVSDYQYRRHIIRTFIDNLATLQLGESPVLENVYHLSDPIEKVIGIPDVNPVSDIVDPIEKVIGIPAVIPVSDIVETGFRGKPINVNEAVMRFGNQDNLKRSDISGKHITLKLNPSSSKAFISSRSLCKGSINSALLTVCLKALMDTLSSKIRADEVVEMSFMFMVDLRRYLKNKREFNGCASSDLKCRITLQDSIQIEEFWKIANLTSDKIREAVQNDIPLRVIRDFDIKSYLDNIDDTQPDSTILFTHVGTTDDFLGENTIMELLEVQTNANASLVKSPLFYIMTHVYKEELHFTIIHNPHFISYDIAKSFANNIHTLIMRIST